MQVATAHYDNSRIGSNSGEQILTPSNVSKLRIRSCPADAAIYGQPLYIPNVDGKNLIIAATMNDSLFAWDADAIPCTEVWANRRFDTPWTGGFPNGGAFYGDRLGCVATPAIDSANGFVYAVCTGSAPTWKLWKFNLSDGSIVSSVTIAPSVAGTGDPVGGDLVSGGLVHFYQRFSVCSVALTLSAGNVYVGCGSFDDVHPWHGWAIAYDAGTLAQTAVWCSTPNGGGGSFWMARGGFAVDGSGNLYGVTGNGDYNGVSNFGMSAVKLSPSLALLDWYTPSNWSPLNDADIDLGSGQPMLIPGTSLLVWGAKDYKVYSVNTGCMGHLGGAVGGCTGTQAFLTNPSPPGDAQAGIYTNAYMNGIGFFGTTYVSQADVTFDFPSYLCTLSGSAWNTTCTASAASWQYPGAVMSASSNSGADAILWLVTVGDSAHEAAAQATLRAVNPTNFTEYWNSGTGIGQMSKFIQPTITAGKVLLSTYNNGVVIFSLP